MKNMKGFTLVELLAVIAILAIILAIVAPKVYKSIDESKRRSCEIQLNYIKDGASTFFTKYRYNSLGASTYDDEAKGLNGVDITLRQLMDASILKGSIVNPVTDETLDLDNTKINIRNIDEDFSFVISEYTDGTWKQVVCE